MPAIAFNNLRRQNTDKLIEDITDVNNSYYMFIGRPQTWTPTDATVPTPTDTLSTQNDVWQNITSMKLIPGSQTTHVVKRYIWTSGQTYTEWDDQDPDIYTKPFYVMTDELNVYKCIRAGSGASIIKPTGTATSIGNILADGYQWKYMLTMTGSDVNNFLINTFMPVRHLLADDSSLQWLVQQAAVPGAINRIKVINGGSGYSPSPTVTVTGNGSGCTATAVVNAGVITGINIVTPGNGYDIATITITDSTGINATARAVLSPVGGHGSNPITELGAYYIMINARLEGLDGGDLIVDNDFRQIGLLKNPYNYGTTTIATATTKSALRILNYTSLIGGSFAIDAIVTGTTSGAKGIIVSTSTGLIKIIQNSSTGFTAFNDGETLSSNEVTATLSSQVNPEVEPFSGEIMYVDNRSPINRATDQTEDVKLIIEL